jgi:hypothetical protein
VATRWQHVSDAANLRPDRTAVADVTGGMGAEHRAFNRLAAFFTRASATIVVAEGSLAPKVDTSGSSSVLSTTNTLVRDKAGRFLYHSSTFKPGTRGKLFLSRVATP